MKDKNASARLGTRARPTSVPPLMMFELAIEDERARK